MASGKYLGGIYDDRETQWRWNDGSMTYSNHTDYRDAAKAAGKEGVGLSGSTTYSRKPGNNEGVSNGTSAAYSRSDPLNQAAYDYAANERRRLGNLYGVDPRTGERYNRGYDYDYPLGGFPSYSVPEYSNPYAAKIDELLNRVLSRDEFSYNYADDPLYQQYAKAYQREGERAAQNALADAASMTGGLPSSYAVTAGTQAGNYYAAQLGDKIPELQQLAYSMYLDDINQKIQDLGLVQQMDETQYNRYRDTVADNQYAYNMDYNIYRDSIGDNQWQQQFDYNKEQDDRNYAYNTGNNAYDRALELLKMGIMPDSSTLSKAQLTDDEARSYMQYYQTLTANSATGRASSGGSRRSSSGRSSSGSTSSGTGGSMNSLFEDMRNSSSPQLYLAQNYKKYGVAYNQISNVLSAYNDWAEKLDSATQGALGIIPTIRGNSASGLRSQSAAATPAPALVKSGNEFMNTAGDSPMSIVRNREYGTATATAGDSDDYYNLRGVGRVPYTELLDMVESGEVEEYWDKEKNRYSYRLANSKK